MCPFNSQRELPSSSHFPGIKFFLWPSTCLCKSCTNFNLPQINLFYSIHPLCQQWLLPESLSGWKMAKLLWFFCLVCSVANWGWQSHRQMPVEKPWNNLEQNGQHGKKALCPSCLDLWSQSNNPVCVQEPSLKQGEAVLFSQAPAQPLWLKAEVEFSSWTFLAYQEEKHQDMTGLKVSI